MGAALMRWLFSPVPLGRVAALRTLAYLFIPLDVLVFTPWVTGHADLPAKLYSPLLVGDLLHLPAPTHTLVIAVKWLTVAAGLAAAGGRYPRLLGAVAFFLYFEWMVIAMSYGRVEHDRFAFLVALAVLPTVGKARWGDPGRSAAAGWAYRCIQVAVMLTYFLAAWAKIRFGGWNWPAGASFVRAISRRGTWASHWLLDHPHLLEIGQFALVIGELASPLILLARTDRARTAVAAALVAFHLVTALAVGAVVLPQLIAIGAFLPMERVRPIRWVRSYLPRPPASTRTPPSYVGAPKTPERRKLST
ncbi:MAG TPA: hypothetical protein VHC49_22465 [Mycobacteriales bacterium]|nr:hypothetical protein [Mycobacteriales bacterium]